MITASTSALGALVAGTTGLQESALASSPLTQPEIQIFRDRLETLNTLPPEAAAAAAHSDPNLGEFRIILGNLDERTPTAEFITESGEERAQRKLADLLRSMTKSSRARIEHAALYASALPRLRPSSETPTLLGVASKDGDEVRGILERSQLGRMEETREILQKLKELKRGRSAEARFSGSSEAGLDPHFTEWAQIFLGGGEDLNPLVQAAERYKEEKPLWSAKLFFLAGLMAHSNENPKAADYFLEAGHQYDREDEKARSAAAIEAHRRYDAAQPRDDSEEAKMKAACSEPVAGGPGDEAYHNYIRRWNIHAAQAYFLATQAAEGDSAKTHGAYGWAAQSVSYNDPYCEAMKLKWAFRRREVEVFLYRSALAYFQSEYGHFLLSPRMRGHFFPFWQATGRATSESNLLATLHLLDANVNGVDGRRAEENLRMARAAWEEANSL